MFDFLLPKLRKLFNQLDTRNGPWKRIGERAPGAKLSTKSRHHGVAHRQAAAGLNAFCRSRLTKAAVSAGVCVLGKGGT